MDGSRSLTQPEAGTIQDTPVLHSLIAGHHRQVEMFSKHTETMERNGFQVQEFRFGAEEKQALPRRALDVLFIHEGRYDQQASFKEIVRIISQNFRAKMIVLITDLPMHDQLIGMPILPTKIDSETLKKELQLIRRKLCDWNRKSTDQTLSQPPEAATVAAHGKNSSHSIPGEQLRARSTQGVQAGRHGRPSRTLERTRS